MDLIWIQQTVLCPCYLWCVEMEWKCTLINDKTEFEVNTFPHLQTIFYTACLMTHYPPVLNVNVTLFHFLRHSRVGNPSTTRGWRQLDLQILHQGLMVYISPWPITAFNWPFNKNITAHYTICGRSSELLLFGQRITQLCNT